MAAWATKIGGGLFVLAAFGLLVWMYGKTQFNAGQLRERTAWQSKATTAAEARLAGFQAGVAVQRQGETVYERTVTEKVVPVIKTIIERSTEYAATRAGQLICLAPERVHGLDEARATLFPAPATTTPGSDPPAVRPNPPVRE